MDLNLNKDHWLLYILDGKDKYGKDKYITIIFKSYNDMIFNIEQNNYSKIFCTRIPIMSWYDPEFIERYRIFHGNCCH